MYDTDKLDWGLLVQFSSGVSPWGSGATSEIEAWSFQVATGPSYRIRDDLAAYGGIFYHLLRGERETPFDEEDLDENDPIGGLVGLDWQVKENAHWTFELQYAGATFAIGTGLRWMLN